MTLRLRLASPVRHNIATFPIAAALAAVTFFGVGWFRGRIVESKPLFAGLETVLIGGVAAGLAYVVGLCLKGLV